MSKLDKIIGYLNLIYPLFIAGLGSVLLAAITTTLGLSIILAVIFIPIIWGFVNSIKYFRKKGFREYSFMEKILILVPCGNMIVLFSAMAFIFVDLF